MNVSLRLAATVIIARAADSSRTPGAGVEFYMTRRSARSAFAPDAFVFPGGTVDEHHDLSQAAKSHTLGLERERIAGEFKRIAMPAELPSGVAPIDGAAAAGLWIAAVRELFEEAGILIARTRARQPLDGADARAAGVQAQRAALHRGELTFADFLQRHDWLADAGALTLFSHWITPPSEPRRFDTHFFFAIAPPGQAGRADAVETHDGVWIRARDALARYERREFHLVYPTIKHLERLSPFDSIDDAFDFARTKPIFTIMPTASAQDDGFVMPLSLEDAW